MTLIEKLQASRLKFYIAFLLNIFIWIYAASAIFLIRVRGSVEDFGFYTLYRYAYYYRDAYTYKQIGISLLLASVVFLLFITNFFDFGRKLFGDAKLATFKDIKKAGLLGKTGIVCGKFKKNLLLFGSSLHVLLSAPTGKGKGVSVVNPTLLVWPDSVVAVDMKGELFGLTSKFRKLCGQEVYFFNPLAVDYKTNCWNPLHYVSDDPNLRIDDILKIAEMLFSASKPNEAPIWYQTPKLLFLGICLYIIETGGKLTMGEVLRTSLIDGDPKSFFEDEISNKKLSRECVNALNAYCAISADQTRSGVAAGFRAALSLWINPITDTATSRNDFDLRDVRKKRMSIYLGVTPDNIDRLAPIINLFFQQLIDLNTREQPKTNKALKHQCLLLMDEFAALGKIPSLSKGIAYIRGYGLRLMCVIQSPAQLVDIYGQAAADNFSQNHAMTIVFPPKASDVKTAKEISEWLGYQTVKNKSQSGSVMPFSKNGPSETKSDHKRALLMPQEISAMAQGKSLVILENCPPIMADMAYFYKDNEFVDRLRKVSPLLRKINGFPAEKDYENAIFSGELASEIPTLRLSKIVEPVDGIMLNHKWVAWGDVPKPEPGDITEDVLHERAEYLVNKCGVKIYG